MKIDYEALKAYVNENRAQFDALASRLEKADETLTAEEAAKIYYASPFAGYEPLADLVKVANSLYKIRDYRVAYFMYRDALVQEPFSLLLLKKAANCSYYDVIDRKATDCLLSSIAKLQEAIFSTGDGNSAETAFKVVKTSDAYQILWDKFQVRDVLNQSVVKTDGEEVYNELTVMVRDEKEPRKIYFACYGETEADQQDFFIRKKGF